MKKSILLLIVCLLSFGLSAGQALAMTLESIGVSTVGGITISSWTYQGTNPVIVGTADPGATVTVTIDGTAAAATADDAGDWSYTPTTLTTSGSYPITIASGTESMSFTLALTTNSTSTTTTTSSSSTSSAGVTLPEELPQTGSFGQTLVLAGSGLALVLAGVLFYWKVVPKLLFEEVTEVDQLD